MATIKRPKRLFNTEEEREAFINLYTKKLKTEICRNWELMG
jgi:hypothetical protein